MPRIGPKPVWNHRKISRKLKRRARRAASAALIGDMIFFVASVATVFCLAFLTDHSESLCALATMMSLCKLCFFINHINLYAPLFDFVERSIDDIQGTHLICTSVVQFIGFFEIVMVIWMVHSMHIVNLTVPLVQISFAVMQCLFCLVLDRLLRLALEEMCSYLQEPRKSCSATDSSPSNVPIVQVVEIETPRNMPQIIVTTV